LNAEVLILIGEAVAVYCLVLGAHALRHHFGLAHYYALIGAVTAIMSWVTDAGVVVSLDGVNFMVGSTVFYTSLLLGVFVVYVFDGPRATRVAISTVIGVSIMVPVIALCLNLQMKLAGSAPLGYVPTPSLRINAASVFATFMDLIFLAVAWEYLNKRAHGLWMGVRAFLTLLGVMWLDVLLFNTGAFLGEEAYLATMTGTALSRVVVAFVAAPLLWAYLAWQNRRWHAEVEDRPVLAILHQFAEIKQELSQAQREIERRKQVEKELMESRQRLHHQATTDELTGLANRRRFVQAAQREVSRARRYGRPLALAVLDVDHFKGINDSHGHEAGDQVLVELARRGQELLRENDLLSRVGGEEFAWLLPETDKRSAAEAAERLRHEMSSRPVETPRGPVSFTVSLGVAGLRPQDESWEDLMNRADRALYQAKAAGRDRVRTAD
jgi:diguanylate cyclase (GGDEF)-like protein